MRVLTRNRGQLVPIDRITGRGSTGGFKWTFIPQRQIVDFAPGPWPLPYPSATGHLQKELAGISSATAFQFSTNDSLKVAVSSVTNIGLVISAATANTAFTNFSISAGADAGLGGPFYYGGALSSGTADKFGTFNGIYAGSIGYAFQGSNYGMSSALTSMAWTAITSAFTVGLWFYTHLTAPFNCFFFKSSTATYNTFGTEGPHVSLRMGGGAQAGMLQLINATGGVSSVLTWTASANVTTGAWHHMAATWSQTGGTRFIYFDGVSVTSGSQNQVLGTNLTAGPLYIGKHGDQNGYIGLIDDVVLFNRLFSAAEIASLTTQAFSTNSLTADNFLQFYYSFNTPWQVSGHAAGSATPVYTTSGGAGFDQFVDYVYGVPETWMWVTGSPTGFYQSSVSSISGGGGFFENVFMMTGQPTTWMWITGSPTGFFQSNLSGASGGGGFFEFAASGVSGTP